MLFWPDNERETHDKAVLLCSMLLAGRRASWSGRKRQVARDVNKATEYKAKARTFKA